MYIIVIYDNKRFEKICVSLELNRNYINHLYVR